MKFKTNDLCSKWGFGDGDMLEGRVEQLLEKHMKNDDWFDESWWSFSRSLLTIIVKKYIFPYLKNEFIYIGDQFSTIHNHMRITYLDGVRIYDDRSTHHNNIDPEEIEVPNEIIEQEFLELLKRENQR